MNDYDKAYQRYCTAYDALHGPFPNGTACCQAMGEFRAAVKALKTEEIRCCPLDYKYRSGHQTNADKVIAGLDHLAKVASRRKGKL